MKGTLEEFKKFLMQGDLVTLAVAFVIGAAFALVVKQLVTDLITPIIGMIIGKADFSNLSFTINSSKFLYGDFLNAVIAFVTTAAAVFFFVVKPYNAVQGRRSRGADPAVKTCPECTTEIPFKARRCPACTSQLKDVAPA